jgi:hypothetical protein
MSIPVRGSDEGSDNPDELTALFAAYRDACPEIETGPDFIPGIWTKIDARQSFWFSFERLGRGFAAAAVAVCLLLAVLNFTSNPRSLHDVSYLDGLAAEHTSAEQTFYAEGIKATVPDFGSSESSQ